MAVFYPDRVIADYNAGKYAPGFYWHAIDEGVPDVADPITGDEMLELHSLLSSHEGALTELLVKR